MNELPAFVELGFRHIVDPHAVDHLLFLLALAVIYRPADWRSELWAVSAFTVGHSVTLALAVSGALVLPTSLIEFLIPVTIVATCIENIAVRDAAKLVARSSYRPMFAGVFGLVHGAGFANYLRDIMSDGIGLPLLGFNLGIEAGQIFILAAAAAGLAVMDRLIRAARAGGSATVFRARVLTVSTVVMVFAAKWALERSPW